MHSAITVPITFTQEADAYIDEIGKRTICERMLDNIPVYYSGVRSIEVTLGPDYEEGGPPAVLFEVGRVDVGECDTADSAYDRWVIATFTPQEHVGLVVMWYPV